MEKKNDIKDLIKGYKIDRKNFIQEMVKIDNKINEYSFVIDYMKRSSHLNDEKIINTLTENRNFLKQKFDDFIANPENFIDYTILKSNFNLINSKYKINVLNDYIFKNKTQFGNLTEEEEDFFIKLKSKIQKLNQNEDLEKIKEYKNTYKKLSNNNKEMYKTASHMQKQTESLKAQFEKSKKQNIENQIFNELDNIIENEKIKLIKKSNKLIKMVTSQNKQINKDMRKLNNKINKNL